MLKEYIAYLKDNPNGYWFKRKLYGWGWTPAKWQGWCVILIYVLFILSLVLTREDAVSGNPDSGSNFLTFALPIIVLTILLVIVAYKKGEKPRWQWGKSENKTELLQKVEQFVAKVLEKAENNHDLIHSQKTIYWIKQLKPDADEALLIAGALHDIERAFYGDWKAGTSEIEALKKHQDMSADEAEKFLKQENASEDIINRVKHLISAHETGGDDDQNILCDADCLAWFEDKAIRNIKKHKLQRKPKEAMKEKLDYLISRISTGKAKEIVQKWYAEALEELNKD